jgi:hypothetical protein
MYLYVSRTLADPGEHRVLAWLSVVLVAMLGTAAIVAMTVVWPRERAPGAGGDRLVVSS